MIFTIKAHTKKDGDERLVLFRMRARSWNDISEKAWRALCEMNSSTGWSTKEYSITREPSGAPICTYSKKYGFNGRIA